MPAEPSRETDWVRGESPPAAALQLPVIQPPAHAERPPRRDRLRSAPAALATLHNASQEPRGRPFWRSLEELAETAEFQAYLHREFPENAAEWCGASRRDFLKRMGASLALAGLTGCDIRQPREAIVPLVHAAGQAAPGSPLDFCTAQELGGWATGLVVQSRMGRPVKVEGNPRHPASRGATGIFAQAATLELYDPDRASTVTFAGQISTPAALRGHLAALRAALDQTDGEGLRILTTATRSPTFGRLARTLQQRWPAARWHTYDAISAQHAQAGNRMAWGDQGANVDTLYRFDRASVVLSIGADFLAARDTPPAWITAFADARRIAGRPDVVELPPPQQPLAPQQPDDPLDPMLRLYAIESMPTLTSAKADHHLTLNPQQIVDAMCWLAAELQVIAASNRPPLSDWTAAQRRWLSACALDLQRQRPEQAAAERAGEPGSRSEKSPLVIAGREQPPVVQALAHAINDALGATGQSVQHVASVSPVGARWADGPAVGSLAELTDAMRSGRVGALIILGGNPVFDAPADVPFAAALPQVIERLHLSLDRNETSVLCQWHVPHSHFLESWGDTRAVDGTASIVQPLIEPLYDSLTPIELIGQLMAGENAVDAYPLVRQTWLERSGRQVADGDGSFDDAWQQWLRAGVIDGTEFENSSQVVRQDFSQIVEADLRRTAGPQASVSEPKAAAVFDVLFRPDPTVWDGRFANNGWLQELPKPMTKLTWDNAALISPADAARLDLRAGDLVQLAHDARQVVIPVWVMPRQAPGTLTLFFGYGRRQVGQVGAATGFDVYPLRTSRTMWLAENVRLTKTGQHYPLASTQHHHLMNERPIVRVGTRAQLRANPQRPEFVHPTAVDKVTSFYPPWQDGNPRWGMTVDLTACTGCTACVIACQAENNIPVVGKAEVQRNREMHWMRVDMYYSGASHDPDGVYHQPVPCMHCELAPCEVVCPVAATTHSEHGLNQMIYNRCVGTRYCSNNCPYKVRRFNFFDYSQRFIDARGLRLLSNPEVTVRSRGVMEKCTYCVQRIKTAEIAAALHDRPLRDGQVATACQQVCPANAIVFGDLSDSSSRVHRLHQHPLNYALLEELNTRPRTTYLAEVKNPTERPPAAPNQRIQPP